MGMCGFPMSFFGKTIGDHSVSVKPASLMWSAAVLWTLSLEGPPLLRCAVPVENSPSGTMPRVKLK